MSLNELEKKHHIPQRWEKADPEYIQMQKYFSTEKLSYMSEALWATASRRQFLLSMKAKYAGKHYLLFMCFDSILLYIILFAEGQKIAKRL